MSRRARSWTVRLSGETGVEEHEEVLLLLLEAAGEDGTIMVRIVLA